MAIQNPYDHALKILARTWPEQFLQLGFPNQPFRLIGAESNVELAMEIDRVDGNFDCCSVKAIRSRLSLGFV
ncbi:MAG: hypothetical protein DYG89_15790 [Caldilinea sp. CFX5]|nr:hypothetical protein [Caldilinea sp. CFX5]